MPCRPGLSRALAATAAALLLFGAASAGATTNRPLAPGDVDALAARIVEGRCIAARPVTLPDTSFPVTEYVFALDGVGKGEALSEAFAAGDRRLVIRQAGGLTESGHRWGITGMPAYAVGGRYRLALWADSARGLTSPVGFGQGVRLLAPPPGEPRADGATP